MKPYRYLIIVMRAVDDVSFVPQFFETLEQADEYAKGLYVKKSDIVIQKITIEQYQKWNISKKS